MKFRLLGCFLLSIVFPEHCPFCDALSPHREPCENCADVPRKAGSPRTLPGKSGCLCVSPFRYEGEVRQSILHFKFHGRRDYASYFGRQIAEEIRQWMEISDCIFVPVPISRHRMRERGYNQSFLLARAAAEKLGIPCVELLEKVKNNKTQHDLPRKEREKNVKAVYRVKKGKNIQKEILLLDDIITTGFTLAECVSTLEAAGFHVRCCATIAENSREIAKLSEESRKP